MLPDWSGLRVAGDTLLGAIGESPNDQFNSTICAERVYQKERQDRSKNYRDTNQVSPSDVKCLASQAKPKLTVVTRLLMALAYCLGMCPSVSRRNWRKPPDS